MIEASPMAPLYQRQNQEEHEFQTIVDEIAKLDIAETASALHMGDLLLELETQYGTRHLRRAAEEAGVTWRTARERLLVSRRIPLNSPIRRMRSLSFSHLRAIAGTEDPLAWAERAEEESMSVRTLIEAIAQAGDQAAQQAGAPCSQCQERLKEEGELVALTVGRGRRTRLCGKPCAIAYLQSAKPDPEPDPWATFAPWAQR